MNTLVASTVHYMLVVDKLIKSFRFDYLTTVNYSFSTATVLAFSPEVFEKFELFPIISLFILARCSTRLKIITPEISFDFRLVVLFTLDDLQFY